MDLENSGVEWVEEGRKEERNKKNISLFRDQEIYYS